MPPYALEHTPPNVVLIMKPQAGITLDDDYAGQLDLQHRREYLITLQNLSQKPIELFQALLNSPVPIEVANIISSTGVGNLTFDSGVSMGISASKGVQVKMSINGCSGHPSYTLKAVNIGGHGRATIAMILNSSRFYSTQHGPSPRPPAGQSSVNGDFVYSYEGKKIRVEYYAPLTLGDDDLVTLENREPKPKGLWQTAGFVMLPGPCIPAALLFQPLSNTRLDQSWRSMCRATDTLRPHFEYGIH